MKNWTFFIYTFGCKVNQYETQAIKESWQNFGGTEVTNEQDAEIILINSCAVTGKAERDARAAILGIQRKAPQAKCIITGCSAQLAGEQFLNSANLQHIIPNNSKAVLLGNPFELPTKLPIFTEYQPFKIKNFQRSRPVLKVQDGCSRHCTYCIVPLKRGKSISRKAEEIIAEANNLLSSGFAELIISGINLAQYGRDLNNKPDFWDIAKMLDEHITKNFSGKARLRISSLDPNQLDDKALQVLQNGSNFCKHLHLSIQSGSHNILKLMGRGDQNIDNLPNIINKLHKIWPQFGLGADILMGFPGEASNDVDDTLNLIKAIGITYAHVFPFAPRPGTAAANFKNQISKAEKSQRTALIRKAVADQSTKFYKSLLGQNLNIILDGSDSKKGINEYYAPCELASAFKKVEDYKQIIKAKAIDFENGVLKAWQL